MNKIIFILPYAGGNSLTYLSWQKYIKNYKIYALDYKGHGLRIKEQLCSSIEEMAEDISEQIKEIILKMNEKFVIFGHSLGGIIAWHTINILRKKYEISPEKLYISSCSTPIEFHKIIHFKISGENEEEQNKFLLKQLSSENHINKKIIENRYFKKVFLPIIKHDYLLIDAYCFDKSIEKIDFPIQVFYAKNDKLVKKKNILKWQDLTVNDCKFLEFPGNHFYFEDENNKERLCNILDSFSKK